MFYKVIVFPVTLCTRSEWTCSFIILSPMLSNHKMGEKCIYPTQKHIGMVKCFERIVLVIV